MDQNVHFQTCVTYDLAIDKESIYCSRANNLGVIFPRILIIAAILWLMITSFPYTGNWLIPAYLVFLLAMQLGAFFRLRNGSLSYKQITSNNNGIPPTNIISFLDDRIQTVNPTTGNVYTYNYSQVRKLLESRNYLFIVLDFKQFVPINKQTLTGGNTDDLAAFLKTHCTSMKKRIHKGTFGRVVNVVYAAVLIVSLVLSLFNVLGIGRINANADFREIAAQMEQMGITGADDALIADLEDTYAGYDDVYISYKVTDYLSWVGMGEYDSTTWEWTPSENGVYWFDMEIWDISNMYTYFLRGVSALSIDELNFENIEMIVDESDLAEGTGDCAVRFTWNDETYTIDAELYYDWLDLSVADKLSQIIREQNTGKQLYYAFDGGQGFLVFYRDPIWALHFQHKTGIQLYTSLSGNFY